MKRATRERLLRRFPQASEAKPPADVQHAIDGIIALLSGEPCDLTDVVIDDGDDPGVQSAGLCDHARDPARPDDDLRRDRRAAWRSSCWRATSAGARAKSDARSSCRAIACLPPAARPAAFRPVGGVATKLRLLTIEGAQPGGPTLFEHLPLGCAQARLKASRRKHRRAPETHVNAHSHEVGQTPARRAAITTATSRRPWCAPRLT